MKHVLLIDASHLYMGARELLNISNSDFDRGRLLALSRQYLEDSGIELWRIYWFDAPSAPDMAHKVTGLAEFDDVHVVLGSRNFRGTQKGVDANLIKTLMEIASWSGETVVHVVAGDDDFIPAMNLATSRGLHVRLWHLEGSKSVTAALRHSVDRTRSVDANIFADAFMISDASTLDQRLSEALSEAPRDYGYNLGATASQVQSFASKGFRPRIPPDHLHGVLLAISAQLEKEYHVIESADEDIVQQAFWQGFDIGQDIQKQSKNASASIS